MVRHWSARVLHAFLAIWFVLSVGEPSVAHYCPMHGGMLEELVAGHRMGGAHAPMDMQRASSRSSHHPSAHHHCTCITCCVGVAGTGAVLAAAQVALPDEAWIDSARARPRTANVLPRPAPAYAQPLATGPPRV